MNTISPGKNIKPRLLGEAGFSLVELMTVVAIIGLMSSIAVPNYQRMVARARQVEAKSALGAMYVVEKAYFAEYASFTVCLYKAGYEPDGGHRYYTSGMFIGPGYDPATTWDFAGTPCDYGNIPWKDSHRNDGIFASSPDILPCLDSPDYLFSTASSFTAGAVGTVSSSGFCDRWSINDRKEIIHAQDGT